MGVSSIDEDENGPAALQELKYIAESYRLTNEKTTGKQLLGDRRLSVIFCDVSVDFRKLYEHGVQNGFGTREAQETTRKWVEDMTEGGEREQREHLSLSSQARFTDIRGKARTHNIQFVERKVGPRAKPLIG